MKGFYVLTALKTPRPSVHFQGTFYVPENTMKGFCPDFMADDLKLRPREWSILRYLLSQFPNGHLFEAFYKRISMCLLNEKYVNWRTWRTLYLPLVCLHDETLNLFAALVDIFVICRFFWKLISCPFLIQNFHSVHFQFKKSRVRNQLIITKLFIALNKIYKIFKNFRTCFKFSNLFSIL